MDGSFTLLTSPVMQLKLICTEISSKQKQGAVQHKIMTESLLNFSEETYKDSDARL